MGPEGSRLTSHSEANDSMGFFPLRHPVSSSWIPSLQYRPYKEIPDMEDPVFNTILGTTMFGMMFFLPIYNGFFDLQSPFIRGGNPCSLHLQLVDPPWPGALIWPPILQAPEALVFIVGSHADLVLEHPETEVTPAAGTEPWWVSERTPVWFGAWKFMAPPTKTTPKQKQGWIICSAFRKGTMVANNSEE